MEVKVLYFAVLRDITGKDGEIIRFTGRSTDELRILLKNKYPQGAKYFDISRFAVNGEYYEGELKEGDTVAIIPPVSGGYRRGRSTLLPYLGKNRFFLSSNSFRAFSISPLVGFKLWGKSPINSLVASPWGL